MPSKQGHAPTVYSTIASILAYNSERHLICLFHSLPNWSAGTKLDLRTDPKTLSKLEDSHSPPITEEEGHEIQRKLGAALYLECSSLTQTGLKEVFMEACRLAQTPVKRTKKSFFCSDVC